LKAFDEKPQRKHKHLPLAALAAAALSSAIPLSDAQANTTSDISPAPMVKKAEKDFPVRIAVNPQPLPPRQKSQALQNAPVTKPPPAPKNKGN
jgi:hypothetical protein